MTDKAMDAADEYYRNLPYHYERYLIALNEAFRYIKWEKENSDE
jgi:hypothetical protein